MEQLSEDSEKSILAGTLEKKKDKKLEHHRTSGESTHYFFPTVSSSLSTRQPETKNWCWQEQ